MQPRAHQHPRRRVSGATVISGVDVVTGLPGHTCRTGRRRPLRDACQSRRRSRHGDTSRIVRSSRRPEVMVMPGPRRKGLNSQAIEQERADVEQGQAHRMGTPQELPVSQAPSPARKQPENEQDQREDKADARPLNLPQHFQHADRGSRKPRGSRPGHGDGGEHDDPQGREEEHGPRPQPLAPGRRPSAEEPWPWWPASAAPSRRLAGLPQVAICGEANRYGHKECLPSRQPCSRTGQAVRSHPILPAPTPLSGCDRPHPTTMFLTSPPSLLRGEVRAPERSGAGRPAAGWGGFDPSTGGYAIARRGASLSGPCTRAVVVGGRRASFLVVIWVTLPACERCTLRGLDRVARFAALPAIVLPLPLPACM
jgi:hypothetical protein